MKKYLLLYNAGFDPVTLEDFESAKQAWDEWFEEMGDAVLDRGHPVDSNHTVHRSHTVTSDGGRNPVIRYSMIQAEDKDEAVTLVKKCPMIEAGGDIQIAEVLSV